MIPYYPTDEPLFPKRTPPRLTEPAPLPPPSGSNAEPNLLQTELNEARTELAKVATHLEHARADFQEVRGQLLSALQIDPESRPLPTVLEMAKAVEAQLDATPADQPETELTLPAAVARVVDAARRWRAAYHEVPILAGNEYAGAVQYVDARAALLAAVDALDTDADPCACIARAHGEAGHG